MSVEVRIPDADSPRTAHLALVAILSLATGVLIAWWAAEPERGDDRGATAAVNEAASEEPASDDASSDEPPSGEDAARGAAVAEAEGEPSSGAARGEEAVTEAAGEPPSGAARGEAVAEVEPAPANAIDEPAREAAAAPPPRSSSLRVVQGTVAYIRCDGLPSCPRDEALEAAVWSIVDALPACVDAPSTPGHADIRLDYRGSAAPEIAWRDTFHSTVVRLDREPVMGCLSAALAETRQGLGAERLLVSFRFELVAR